jgi:FKBP-type peptidyl-prolyl cis-trans isomerase SlyD
MQITKNKVVAIDYTLTDEEGEVLDSSRGSVPLEYLHGADNIIPGLERELEGKAAGDTLEVTVAPELAYGLYQDGLEQVVSRKMFDKPDDLEVGISFHAQTDSGPRVFTITEIDGDQITIDGNHPLAGLTLRFDVTVVGVRDATPDEITHGHAHGPDGHHH